MSRTKSWLQRRPDIRTAFTTSRWSRGLIEEFEQPSVGRVCQPKPAAIFEVNASAIGGPAPRLGEHSRQALSDLRYSAAQIETVIADNAIRAVG